MKKYKVTVNGTAYEITLEEISADEVKTGSAANAPAPSAGGEGENVTSPMPGNILSVSVSNGSTVKKGDVLMILEAMKMENEITSPCDGTVKALNVAKGAAVETGTVLCVIG